MNIIPTSTTSFEVIVNNFIQQGKISTLQALGKLLERIDMFLYSQKQPFEKVVKIKERTILLTFFIFKSFGTNGSSFNGFGERIIFAN